MAPLNGAAGKPAKTAARRTASKPVVPALPLNYPQRLSSGAQSVSVSESSGSPPTPARPNGQALHDKTNIRETRKQDESPTELRREGGQSSGRNTDAVTASLASLTMSSPLASGSVVRAASDKITAALGYNRDRSYSHSLSVTPTATTAVPATTQTLASPTPTRLPINTMIDKPRPSDLVVHDHSSLTFPPAMVNRPAFHQPHASNGSLIFGQLHDSNASSPAPPHSGNGFAPPPPPPPGMMPYPQGTRPVPAVDGYGRPLMVSPTLDGYPPSMVSHPGPPTPHSIHGSQSSIPADEASFSSFHSLNGGGQIGHPADPNNHLSSGHALGMNMNSAPHLAGPPPYRGIGEHEELLGFIRHGAVTNDAFSDCVLEVRFPNSPQFADHPEYRRMQPVFRAPAHRFLLSRSPLFAGLMKSMGTPANGLVFLDVRDEYMRPDVFGHVFRTLYGWAFGDPGAPLYSDLQPRNMRDDIKTCLSYVATARYLKLGTVYAVAIQRASSLLCWETIEPLVAFVVPIAAVFERHRDLNASELLEQVVAFIVDQFPQDFVLDANAIDTGFTRLPTTGLLPRNPNAPLIAHSHPARPHSRQSSASQAQTQQRGPANARLSQIRFGDLSPEDRTAMASAGSTESVRAHRQPTLHESIISRILLNLPFELLKRILEHRHLTQRSGVDGNAALHKLMSEIVAEREARRLASLESSNKQLEVLHQALNKAARPLSVELLGDFLVNNMGFKEEVFSGDGPYLGRTWTGGASASTSS